VVQGAGFRHRIYRNGAELAPEGLHVYIEGDGAPYFQRVFVAGDPTPRRPLLLQLMRLDPYASVYVGRPCYFGLASDGRCTSEYWTLGRFSEEVVQSLARAIDAERERRSAGAVVLFGHSGGGALAVLLAARLHDVTRVVTIGGNLDTERWTRLHHFTPLYHSLNPANVSSIPSSVSMLHLAGSADENIPPSIVGDVARAQGARLIVVPGNTHGCCWDAIWRDVVENRFPPLTTPSAFEHQR
jgi:pimeloyl-ACP methyl ester carboxylesterase